MNQYTVLIEERDELGDAWVPLAPPENQENDGTASELARWTADNDTMAAAGIWRVRVWDGADADLTTAESACASVERN